MSNETDILSAATTIEGVAASLRLVADELAPAPPDNTAELEAALAAKVAAEAALVIAQAAQASAQADAAAAEEALAVAQASAATAADAAAAALATANLALTEAQTQTVTLAGQLTGLQEALAAEELDDAGMLAQIADAQTQITALQAALEAAQTNPPPPPVGNPLRLYAGISAQQGGLMGAKAVRYAVFADDTLQSVVASGNASLSSLGVLDVPITAPFAVGALMPVLVTVFDPAVTAADRTVLTSFGWVQAQGVA
jgi:hypothetical protein